MSSEPPTKKPSSLPDPAAGEAGDEFDRPTVNPPFDLEEFARKAASGSQKPDAPVTPPPPLPPLPDFDLGPPRSEQPTLTNEIELEKARQQSLPSRPPRGPSIPVGDRGSILSIADARAPSAVPPPPQNRSVSPSSIERAVLGAVSPAAAPEITERTIEDPLAEMRERFSLGDYTGALEMAELILAQDPGNLDAAECGENCRSVLENMYAARLGPLDRVPMVVVPRAQMRWLSIDHRAGFILSLIDGASSVEMILDVSGMPRLDALRILHELVQQKVVSFR